MRSLQTAQREAWELEAAPERQMAEPVERPAETGDTPGPRYPDAERPGTELSPLPRADSDAYRPLSLVAVAGLFIDCVWLLILLLWGGFAVFSRTPLLLSGWLLLLPLAGTVLGCAAWLQIQRSEGTRAGAAVARWAVVLGVFLGLGYCAYWAAVYLAVRQQADTFVQQWFDQLRAGEGYAAFRLTLDPGRRPREGQSAEQLRNELESRHNIEGEKGQRGPLNQLLYSPWVRDIEEGGPATQFTSLGISEWEYHQAGYVVRLNYQVDTPEKSFQLLVSLKEK